MRNIFLEIFIFLKNYKKFKFKWFWIIGKNKCLYILYIYGKELLVNKYLDRIMCMFLSIVWSIERIVLKIYYRNDMFLLCSYIFLFI